MKEIAIAFGIIIGISFTMGIMMNDTNELSENRCIDFVDTTIKDLPARCLHYFVNTPFADPYGEFKNRKAFEEWRESYNNQ